MRFVGYSLTSKGYRLFDDTNKRLLIRRDVEFNEEDFGQKPAVTSESYKGGKRNVSTAEEEEVAGIKESKEDKQERKPAEETEETRRSKRTRKRPVRYGYNEYAGTATHGVYQGCLPSLWGWWAHGQDNTRRKVNWTC